MTINLKLNKRIHEIMALCWHVQEVDGRPLFCSKCRKFIIRRDFTKDWSAFGLMWEFMQKHENGDTWKDFWSLQYGQRGRDEPESWVLKFISPRPFAEAMCAFFKERR